MRPASREESRAGRSTEPRGPRDSRAARFRNPLREFRARPFLLQHAAKQAAARDDRMPRRGVVSRREILPDPVYQSTLVTKFVNVLLIQGKKSTADRILYGAFDVIRDRTKDDPLKIFKKAIDNVRPALEVKARRVGGSTYQIPVEVNPNRRLSLAMRWIKLYASQRGGKSMREKLAAEIVDASNNTGGAIKKREDTHKMAEANKAFAHYRW